MHLQVTVWIDMDVPPSYGGLIWMKLQINVWIDMDEHSSYCMNWYGCTFKLLCGCIRMHLQVTLWIDTDVL